LRPDRLGQQNPITSHRLQDKRDLTIEVRFPEQKPVRKEAKVDLMTAAGE
jgi:hypothetical protein